MLKVVLSIISMWMPRVDTFNYTPNPEVSKEKKITQINLEKINESICSNDVPSNKNLCHKLTSGCCYSRVRYIVFFFCNSGQLICQEFEQEGKKLITSVLVFSSIPTSIHFRKLSKSYTGLVSKRFWILRSNLKMEYYFLAIHK